MRRYFQIYREFFLTSLSEATSFRLHFFLLILMDLVFFASTLYSIDFLYHHISQIGHFSRAEFMFFAAYMLTLDQIHMTLISESFWVLAQDIRSGQLDYWLLKPAQLHFSLFLRHIRTPSLLTLMVAAGLLIHFGSFVLDSTWQWLCLPVLLLFSLILLTLLEILISSLMFYVIEGMGINFMRLQIQSVARWPHFIYHPLIQKIFTLILPVLWIGSAPVNFLLQADAGLLLPMLAWIPILLWLIRFSWKRALRQYESASS